MQYEFDAAPPPPPKPIPDVDFLTAPAYALSKSNVDTFCRGEWTKRGELDQSMFGYCVRKETDAHADLRATLKRLKLEKWTQGLFPRIWAEWTKAGVTQYTMVAYGLKGEEDSLKTYRYDWEHHTVTEAKAKECSEKWEGNSKQWTMTVYCYKH
jgi:hypothetical protein